jgi:hypothetical protein
LKLEVLRDFADGGLTGEGLMAGLVALINDTRESLDEMPGTRNGDRRGPPRSQTEPERSDDGEGKPSTQPPEQPRPA